MTRSIARFMSATALAMIATPALADTTVIQAERVIVAPDAPPLGQSTITVTDGRIVSIADGWQAAPDGATLVQLPGKTVLPGLIDLHVHLTGDPGGDCCSVGRAVTLRCFLVASRTAGGAPPPGR